MREIKRTHCSKCKKPLCKTKEYPFCNNKSCREYKLLKIGINTNTLKDKGKK